LKGYKISEPTAAVSPPSNPRRHHPGSHEASPVTSPPANVPECNGNVNKDYEQRLVEKCEDLSPAGGAGHRQASSTGGAAAAQATYLSSSCVVYTFYSGDAKAVIDEHFSRALGDGQQRQQRRYDDEESKGE
jgi:hypothetical protein